MSSQSTYQVISRRWRPKQFTELVGQDHIVQTLKNAIELNRIAHAYLFVGPRGTGKTSTARLFAKCLNCENGPAIAPPEKSPICDAIMQGSCMDVIEIDGASNNSVDQVRALREDCQYAPAQCRFKIYIIDEVHMLSTAAFNALLKTLEEPPPHVKFIFATTESHKVLPTITSRCQRFEFRPISEQTIAQKLAIIAAAEGLQVEDAVLRSIARLANGGMRDAQSILDQLIAFCGKNITEADVLSVYGLTSENELNTLASAILNSDDSRILSITHQLAEQGKDLVRTLSDLQSILKNTLLDAVAKQGSSSLLGFPISTDILVRTLDILHEGQYLVKTGLSDQTNFEVLLLKAASEAKKRSIDSLIRELSDLAKSLPASLPSSPESQKKTLIPKP